MKQDIRKLFDKEVTSDLKTLPEGHREAFLKKLRDRKKTKNNVYYWLKVAAVVLLLLSVGYQLLYDNQKTDEDDIELMLIAQVKATEEGYLKAIQTEWQNFIAVAKDSSLVSRFQQKLDELDADYKTISIQFEEDANNVLIVEALVNNLQTRLQILKDIQEHIKILNQNNEHYENTF